MSDAHNEDLNENASEGWDLFELDSGPQPTLQIQRDDEANLFESDAEALAFVHKLAREGSVRHKEALAKHVAHTNGYVIPLHVKSEGWVLNGFVDGPLSIQIDMQDDRYIFEYDADALEFVKSQAAQGSEIHRLALDLHNASNGIQAELASLEPAAVIASLLEALKELRYATTVGVFNSSAHVRALSKAELAITQGDAFIVQ